MVSGVKVSVVVPTYNERENIDELLSRIDASLKNVDYEVVVVDDNSPDGTAERVIELSSRYPVKLVRRAGKFGLSSAILDGVKVCSGDYVVVMDADLQHPPEVVKDLLRYAGEYDIIIASRYVKGGGTTGFPLIRRVISLGATYMARILIPQARKVKDPLSGFFLVRRELIEKTELVVPSGYKTLLDIISQHNNLKICEVPYIFQARVRGKSKLSRKEILNYVKQLLIIMPDYYKFAVVGTSGVLVNLGVLWFLSYVLLIQHFIASVIGIEASLINNFIWNDLWTFKKRRFGKRWWRLLKYHVSTAIGTLAQYTVSQIAYYALLRESLSSQTLGILVGFIANYLISKKYVWARPNQTTL
ncbi:MAG: glycosyltransferase family 2 protein [Desulfurococcaceae archaeon TW002]